MSEVPPIVERVARAILGDERYDALPDRATRLDRINLTAPQEWLDKTEAHDTARDAIAAMREATKPMSEAGWTLSQKSDEQWVSCTPRQMWAVMIDAALAAPGEREES